MTDFLPLSFDAIVGRGTRISADYVLTDPPTALLPCGDFDRTRSLAGALPSQVQSWTAVLNARTGLTVERVRCLSAQVVRIDLIATRSITVGTAVPSFAVIPGFRDIVGPDSIVDRTYQRTAIRRTGDASLADIERAETEARDIANSENPARVAAEEFAESASRAIVGGSVVAVIAFGLGAAIFLFR